MKKIIAFAICVIMVFTLASCTVTFNKPKGELDIDSIKTIGDLAKLDLDGQTWSYSETKYVNVFEYGDKSYRAFADLTKEIYDELDSIDILDDDADERRAKVLENVEINKIEDMAQYVMSDSELAKYVGKTGKELLDEGFETEGFSFFIDQYVYMTKGLCTYDVYFDTKIEYDPDDEEFDIDQEIENLKVKKIVYERISGRATDIEE